jgi:hypothetical protein
VSRSLEQSDNSTTERLTVFIELFTVNGTIDKIVINRFSVVYIQLNRSRVLTFIVKDNGILGVIEKIMGVGCNFLNISNCQSEDQS